MDNVREVIENSQYRPARSRFKIYIIDEAHMLSKAAFNALLKTLEEPPSHVKFILATTEPEKLLPTILSRCQRYDFRNIATREIAAHLKDICQREDVQADEDALLLVAKAGAGSMRDSLSLLDRLLSIGEKRLTAETIEQLLGLPKSQLLFDLADAMGRGDVKAVLGQANAIVHGGLAVDSLIVAFVDHLRNLLVLRTCGPDSTLVEVPGLALADLAAQASRFDPGILAQDITILEELRRTLRQSQAGRALLDATLVRLTLADQFASIGELLSRLDAGGGPSGGPPRTAVARSAPPAPVSTPAQKKNFESVAANTAATTSELGRQAEGGSSNSLSAVRVEGVVEGSAKIASNNGRPGLPASALIEPQESLDAPLATPIHAKIEPVATGLAAPTLTDDSDDDLPAVGKVWSSGPSESLSTLMARHRAATAAPPASPPAPVVADSRADLTDPADLPSVWQTMLGLLAAHGPMLHSLISQGQLTDFSDGRIVLTFGRQHETFVKAWEKNGKKDLIRDAASKALNQNVGVKFEISAEAGESAPAPAVMLSATSSSPPMAAKRAFAPRHPPTTVEAPPATEGSMSIKVTSDLVDSLANANPLIKSVIQRLGAQVVKVE